MERPLVAADSGVLLPVCPRAASRGESERNKVQPERAGVGHGIEYLYMAEVAGVKPEGLARPVP
jgi:hypothetical protein